GWPPRVATSSLWTIWITCCAGLRLFDRSAPTHCSLMRAISPLTTLKLTSASSRARRISRRTSSTSGSPRRPRPRRRLKIPSKRSDRESNMGASGYRGAASTDHEPDEALGGSGGVSDVVVVVDLIVGMDGVGTA